jgi:hypothetical protein
MPNGGFEQDALIMWYYRSELTSFASPDRRAAPSPALPATSEDEINCKGVERGHNPVQRPANEADLPEAGQRPGGMTAMWSSQSHFPFALVSAYIWAGSARVEAFDKQFEGPCKITIAASKNIRATVKSVYRYPNMVAREWWVAYPLPPDQAYGLLPGRGRWVRLTKPASSRGAQRDLRWLTAVTADVDSLAAGEGRQVRVPGLKLATMLRKSIKSPADSPDHVQKFEFVFGDHWRASFGTR